ncbi:MAG: ROK family protein [Gemmatimonadaceae bacterium]
MPKQTRSRYIVGVDLGGTNIVVGVLAEDGSREFAMQTQPTRADQGADSVVDRMVGMIEGALRQTMQETDAKKEDFLGVGVGAPGPLDRANGIVITTPNLGWTNFPLRDVIAERVGLSATIDNDANCATLGEWWLGAAKGGRNVVGMTIGTGIGGGLMLDGQLYHGSSDVAGEIGHMTIDVNGRHCGCGNYGCLEAYASGPSIAERAREAMQGDHESLMYTLVDGELERLTAAIVYDAAKRGDPTALEVVRETSRFLGVGIANLLNVYNPDCVVIAGGVTQAGETLFEPLRREVRKRAFRPAVDACRIVPGSLPGTAGVVGAVATFKQQSLGGI